MADKTQELALALLKEAKKEGALDPSIEAELTELVGTTARPKVTDVLETSAVPEGPANSEQSGAEKNRLAPDQADKLIGMLKTRYEAEGPRWPEFKDIEESLRECPEALFLIQQLEDTGVEVQMVDHEGQDFVFSVPSAKEEYMDETHWTYSIRVKNVHTMYS